MNKDINQIIRKTWSYWYVDGLVEIAAGSIVLLLSIFYAIAGMLGSGTISALILGVGQPLIIIGGIIVAGKVVKYYKERVTFPRTGYVSFPKRSKKRRIITMITSMLISILVGILLISLLPRIGRNYLPLITAFFIFLLLVAFGWRTNVFRFYLLGGIVLLTGVILTWQNLPEYLDFTLLLGVFGLGWVIGGSLALKDYLAHTQASGSGT
jgi:hypothetical protein